jgi:hypothetical protein
VSSIEQQPRVFIAGLDPKYRSAKERRQKRQHRMAFASNPVTNGSQGEFTMSKSRFTKSFSMTSMTYLKSIACALILALSGLGLAAPRHASAQEGGGSAAGRISFSVEEDIKKYLEFSASANADGTAEGRMVFSGPAEIPDQNVDGEEKHSFSGRLEDLFVEAKFDGMVVEGNRAVMSGVVTASTHAEYIGHEVLLVVEDNGAGINDKERPDRFTWGLYRPVRRDWYPQDAERKDDDGWLLRWWATDAERRDDVGYQMRRSEVVNYQTFPVSSYNFADILGGAGDIEVRR